MSLEDAPLIKESMTAEENLRFFLGNLIVYTNLSKQLEEYDNLVTELEETNTQYLTLMGRRIISSVSTTFLDASG